MHSMAVNFAVVRTKRITRLLLHCGEAIEKPAEIKKSWSLRVDLRVHAAQPGESALREIELPAACGKAKSKMFEQLEPLNGMILVMVVEETSFRGRCKFVPRPLKDNNKVNRVSAEDP